jgi:hypothetical protein
MPGLPASKALLLYGMMALAVRFSNLPEFSSIARTNRGRSFAKFADRIIMDSLLDTDLENPSLDHLHGCSLVAVYWLASRPNKKAAFLVGIVVRIAYSLGLNVIDQDLRASEPPQVTDVEWARREELRRAWWLVFECDNFASIIRCQPLTIDRSRMHVLLPSSDHHWHSQIPCPSAFLEADAAQSWRNLEKSPNRNPHAWYLLANELMIRAHEAVRSVRSDPQRRLDIHDAARYANLSVPPELDLSNDVLSFDEETAGHDNWVIALHMMLQGCGFSNTSNHFRHDSLTVPVLCCMRLVQKLRSRWILSCARRRRVIPARRTKKLVAHDKAFRTLLVVSDQHSIPCCVFYGTGRPTSAPLCSLSKSVCYSVRTQQISKRLLLHRRRPEAQWSGP